MKQQLSTYSISGSTVTLTGVNRPLESILLIANATAGTILYSAATGGATAYTQGENSAISLSVAPASTDRLQIFYDDGVASANAPSSVSVNNFPSSTEISNDVGNPIPISAAALPLPTGAAQDGTDGTGITAPTGGSGIRGWLSGIYNRLTLGSKTAANSLPVAIATDQIVSLGAALASQSQPVALATDQLVPLGQATMANSQPVVIASNQSAVPVSGGDLTSGNQTTKIVNGANTLAVDSAGALTANNAAAVYTTFTSTSAFAVNATLVGPINTSSAREMTIMWISVGTGGNYFQVQLSNDGTNWGSVQIFGVTGTYLNSVNTNQAISSGGGYKVILNGMAYARIITSNTITGGTTSFVYGLHQQTTSNLYQTVAISSQPNVTPAGAPTAGSINPHTLVCAATTNATNFKTSSATIGGLTLTNTSASWAYFKFVNKASAPVPGTDTAVYNIGVAPNSTLDCSTGFCGMRLTSGGSYYVSAGASLTDNTALPAAGTFLVNLTYV